MKKKQEKTRTVTISARLNVSVEVQVRRMSDDPEEGWEVVRVLRCYASPDASDVMNALDAADELTLLDKAAEAAEDDL